MRYLTLLFLGLFLVGCGSGGGGSVNAASGVTVEKLAGTWDYLGSGTVGTGTDLCGFNFSGVISISSDGSGTIDLTASNSCDGIVSGQVLTTASISADGSGSLSSPASSSVLPFRISRDLNTMIFAEITDDEWTSAIALRR